MFHCETRVKAVRRSSKTDRAGDGQRQHELQPLDMSRDREGLYYYSLKSSQPAKVLAVGAANLGCSRLSSRLFRLRLCRAVKKSLVASKADETVCPTRQVNRL
jgi:hypothetical protein